MEIINNINNIKNKVAAVVAVGNFDGIHLGHQKVINSLLEESKRLNVKSILITFNPSPREFFQSEKEDMKLITTLNEKKKILSETKLDMFVIQSFNKEFAEVSSRDFIEKIILKYIDVKKIILGSTHTFGKNNDGNAKLLNKLSRKHQFGIKVIEKLENNGYNISSTNLRRLLATGEMDKVNYILGRKYTLKGKIISGKQRGRNLGFPTLNLEPISSQKIIPKIGAYCVEISINNDIYNGMCNVGYNPTFNDKGLSIEVHIINGNIKNINGEEIEIKFHSWLRNERIFKNEKKLIEQLKNDKSDCERYFIHRK